MPPVAAPDIQARQRDGLRERGWRGKNKGVTMYSFHLNISPNTSHGALGCDIVMWQDYTLTIV